MYEEDEEVLKALFESDRLLRAMVDNLSDRLINMNTRITLLEDGVMGSIYSGEDVESQ